jgi:hypothetical protein
LSYFANAQHSPRGGPRGGRGGGPGGARGGKKVIVEPHRHKGVFVARGGKEDLLATTNLVPGESVYGEKRISVENAAKAEDAATTKTEYRVSTVTDRPSRSPSSEHELTSWFADLEPFVSRFVLPPAVLRTDVKQPE